MRKRLSIQEYTDGILSGNRKLLGQAITLIESDLASDQNLAQEIVEKCLPYSANSFRIGISGAPGCGKSTFIENFGLLLVEKGHKLAVLAVDPSSTISNGSILGDKTRMAELSMHPNAFIRPSPSGTMYGGINRMTREAIILCEAAGFDRIIIETVGVGQSEVIVGTMVDFFMVLMLAGAGDDIQGIKRGIIEMADALIFTKTDGDNALKVKATAQEFKRALELFPQKENGWKPEVLTCSALLQEGLDEIIILSNSFLDFTKSNKSFKQNRLNQQLEWLYQMVEQALKQLFYQHPTVKTCIAEAVDKIKSHEITPYKASQQLLDVFLHH